MFLEFVLCLLLFRSILRFLFVCLMFLSCGFDCLDVLNVVFWMRAMVYLAVF